MLWVFGLFSALLVVAIGLITVGRITAQLERSDSLAVFDLEEANGWIAENLGYEARATLSFDEVEQVQRWHLNFLHGQGLELDGSEIETSDDDVFIHEDDGLAYVLGQIESSELDIAPEHAVDVVDTQMRYLVEIGALHLPLPRKGGGPD